MLQMHFPQKQKAVIAHRLFKPSGPCPCLLPLSTVYCLLSTAYCLLPTAYCLLPTAYCLPAYCLLAYAFASAALF